MRRTKGRGQVGSARKHLFTASRRGEAARLTKSRAGVTRSAKYLALNELHTNVFPDLLGQGRGTHIQSHLWFR